MAHAFKGAMFEKMPVESLPRNSFDLSHQRLTTMEQGMLIPVLFQPVNPADRWKVSLSDFVRMMPMFAPIMHQIDISFYAFYERENQLWRNFDDFIRGGDDGNTDYDKPNCGADSFASMDQSRLTKLYDILTKTDLFSDADPTPTLSPEFGEHGFLLGAGSLYDHLGLPPIEMDKYLDADDSISYDWTGFRNNFIKADLRPWDMAGFKMYQDIYNEYFRDEFISEKIEIFRDFDGDMLRNATGPGYNEKQVITPSALQDLFKLRHRAWEKDRFTSALQEPVAIPEVLIPFEAEVNLEAKDQYTTATIYATGAGQYKNGVLGTYGQTFSGTQVSLGEVRSKNVLNQDGGDIYYPGSFVPYANGGMSIDSKRIIDNISARISNVSATINQLRMHVALQEFYEQQARGGNRIKESIMINFNSVIPDYRLDRPQYLGGFKHTLSISQVLQTSSSVGTDVDYQPLGQMAGQGLSGQSGFLFNEYFPEHGYIMVIASIRPRSMYCQGMPKTFQRFNRMQYYWHKLANVGDEPVLNSEIYLDQMAQNNDIADETFGYQTRYSEYKYIANSLHGDFRTNLKDWHLCRFFDETPSLNQDFIEVNAEKQGLNRIFNYQGTDFGHFLVQLQFNISCERVMEIYGIPRFA